MTKPPIHPAVLDAASDVHCQRVSRRDFLRFATLLGTSLTTAYSLLAGQPVWSSALAGSSTGLATSATADCVVKRGGSWASAMQLDSIFLDHPARAYSPEMSNLYRQVCEYLTETGADGITRPYLLERWEASTDIKEWTLYLRKDVTFNNGDKLTSADIVFTFGQWLDPNVGSPLFSLLFYIGGLQNIEVVDDYTLKLHLQEQSITVAEDLFHSAALVLHRNFQGDFQQQPLGTGAFLLEEFKRGEQAKFKRRPDYWRFGVDGQALPYLEEVRYVSLDRKAATAALLAGQVDSIFAPNQANWEQLKLINGLTATTIHTASAFVGRMRVDLPPWDDVRVRTALKLCQDRALIRQTASDGAGDLSSDTHIAPLHPEYAPQPLPAYDPAEAKRLLEAYASEKGLNLPLKVTLATKNDLAEPQIAQTLKTLAAPAGFEITLDITEPNGYWNRWTEVPLGITHWTGRPVATTNLRLAYTADANGKPVSWNETRWVDAEFVDKLAEAEKTLDLANRRVIMGQLEEIMQERGPIFISHYNPAWHITRSEFRGLRPQAQGFDTLSEAWKDDTSNCRTFLPIIEYTGK